MEAAPAQSTVVSSILGASPKAAAYADSIDSSPRSRQTDSWEADPPPAQLPHKLRFMCSYGGHIVHRPHDKTLCYVGGDTRIIVIDRQTPLSELHHRLSKTLLHNQSFSLKYQLPSEDLDSLISVATDEDLENMVEEYDRLNSLGTGLKPRLRLFLFPKSPGSIEGLLVESGSSKSDDWFFNALNGKTGCASDRAFSESSSINNLLGLDDDTVGKGGIGGKDSTDSQIEGSKLAGNGTGNSGVSHDVHSIPDSPMLETTSSFGSTSSSPSVANLPPIKVRVEENQRVGFSGIDDQFRQISITNLALTHKPEELRGFSATPSPPVVPGPVASSMPVAGGEYANRVFSDDVHQLQPQLPQQKQTTDLPSPNSVSSEGNPLSRPTQALYQEPILQIQSGGNTRISPSQTDMDSNSIKIQVQEPGYVLSGQFDQSHPQMHHPQQFIPAGNQFIPAGPMSIASYYSVYPPQQQHQHMMEPQYPFYFMPSRPSQGYNIPQQQPTYSELAPSATSTRPQIPSNAHHVAYGGPPTKSELGSGVAAAAAPQLVQLPSGQHQTPQYVGFGQISGNPTSAFATYEFADPSHAPMYYSSQPLQPQLAAHYQTMARTPTVVLSNASAQIPTENMQQQQVRTLQP